MNTNANNCEIQETNVTPARRPKWVGYFGFDDPLTLINCLHFIIAFSKNNLSPESICVCLNELFNMMFNNNVGNEFTVLQSFAVSIGIALTVWVIDHTEKYTFPINHLNRQENLEQYISYIVFRRDNNEFYLLYVLDDEDIKHISFSMSDPYINNQAEDFHQCFERFNISGFLQQFAIETTNSQPINVQYDTAQISHHVDDSAHNHVSLSRRDERNFLENAQIKTTIENSLQSQFSSTTTILTHAPLTTYSPIENLDLQKPVLLDPVQRLWYSRYLNDGIKKCFIALQPEGGRQRASFRIKFEKVSEELLGRLYIGVCAVDHTDTIHEQNVLVPRQTSATINDISIQNKFECFVFNHDKNPDVFDKKTKCVYSKITAKENAVEEKRMSVAMLICHNHSISQNTIKENKLKWSKLEYALYFETRKNVFVRVSQPTYSDYIQQTSTSQSEYASNNLIRTSLCQNGGQIDVILLDTDVAKEDLFVNVNHRILDPTEFALAGRYLSYVTPAGAPGQDLCIIIYKKSRIDPEKEVYKPYIVHDDHDDPCGLPND